MTTRTLDVGNLFSVLGAHGIERQLRRIDGVGRVSVNPVSGSTTVAYDAARTSLSEIRAAIESCGFHCAGAALPKHVGQDHPAPAKGAPEPVGPAAAGAHRGHAGRADAEVKPGAKKGKDPAHGKAQKDAMAHEIGPGSGKEMQSMVRGMRNRFWIALGFSLPIFAFSPTGMDFIRIMPPFGLRLDLVLFILASGAILYSVWPLAAGVLYPFPLGPSIAAIAMSGSSALVAINALMLKRTRLTGIRRPGEASSAVAPAMATAA